MKLLLLLLIIPFTFAVQPTPTYVTHTLSDGQVIQFHDFTYWCTYTPNCTQVEWQRQWTLYISEMEAHIRSFETIETDVLIAPNIVTSNIYYQSKGSYIQDYPKAVEQLLKIRTLPNGQIDKTTFPIFLKEDAPNREPSISLAQTNIWLLHLLQYNFEQQSIMKQEVCKLKDASEQISWCKRTIKND